MAGAAINSAAQKIFTRRMQTTPREDFGFATLMTAAQAERKPPIVPERRGVIKFCADSVFGEAECNRGVPGQCRFPLDFFAETRFKRIGTRHELAPLDLFIRGAV